MLVDVTNLMTVGEAGKAIGIDLATVRYYERGGLLPALRLSNGHHLFRKEDVEAFIAQRAKVTK